VKKKTPTHDLSWYIKWLATFTIIVGAVFNSFEIVPYNLFVMASGVLLWLLVGLLWFDRALIVLNTAILVIYFSGIIMHPHNLYIRDDVVCIIDSGNVYPYISVEQFVGSITIETTQFNDFSGFKVENCVIVVDNNENV